MESFLNKYLSLCNKNDILVIKLGEKISDDIFKTKLTKNNIDNLLDKLYNLDIKSNVKFVNDIIEYRYNNYIIKKNKKEISYKKINIIDFLNTDKLYLIRINLDQNDNIVPCENEYEKIDKYDSMIININSNFDLIIRDYKEYYTCSIKIKKPNNVRDFMKILNSLNF
jgi:hypothetical protein